MDQQQHDLQCDAIYVWANLGSKRSALPPTAVSSSAALASQMLRLIVSRPPTPGVVRQRALLGTFVPRVSQPCARRDDLTVQ
jgi:hypothetical protein